MYIQYSNTAPRHGTSRQSPSIFPRSHQTITVARETGYHGNPDISGAALK